MKIMLVCAGGMSTGILMNKIKNYASEKKLDIQVRAYGIGDYLDEVSLYDIVLLGPQISYKYGEIKEESGKPIALISPMDYAIGNVEAIINLVKSKVEK
ncbi:MAG: PTS sugar transporter subunit IIB [Sarcina sp.]